MKKDTFRVTPQPQPTKRPHKLAAPTTPPKNPAPAGKSEPNSVPKFFELGSDGMKAPHKPK